MSHKMTFNVLYRLFRQDYRKVYKVEVLTFQKLRPTSHGSI